MAALLAATALAAAACAAAPSPRWEPPRSEPPQPQPPQAELPRSEEPQPQPPRARLPRLELLREPQFYRRSMRVLVEGLARYARERRPGFVVVPQNGLGLLTSGGSADTEPAAAYVEAIDGVGQEELFYGYPRDDRPTPAADTAHLLGLLRLARDRGLSVLVIDYCSSPDRVEDSYRRNAAEGFLGFAAPRRELTSVPRRPPPGENAGDVRRLAEARNFLVLLNPGAYARARSYLAALGRARHDLLILDAFVDGRQGIPRWLSPQEVAALQRKPGGGRRLVLAYLSIGEAESYRYYWRRTWDAGGDGAPDRGAPPWLEGANPHWPGNYKVRYWDPAWQKILYGSPDSYLDGILERGFDGVYLDLVDAYLYFEQRAGKS